MAARSAQQKGRTRQSPDKGVATEGRKLNSAPRSDTWALLAPWSARVVLAEGWAGGWLDVSPFVFSAGVLSVFGFCWPPGSIKCS